MSTERLIMVRESTYREMLEAKPVAYAYVVAGECEQIEWGADVDLPDDPALVWLYAHPAPQPSAPVAAPNLDYLRETLAWVRRNFEEHPSGAREQLDLALGHIVSALSAGKPSKGGPVGTARTVNEWHEDFGPVVWWTWGDGEWLGEPSYIGSPLCDDWPGYHTHWTPHPDFPDAPTAGGDDG